MEIVHGGTEAGIFLSNHSAVTHIHLTGSGKTYDAVVWGKQPKVCRSGVAARMVKTVAADRFVA